MFGEDPALLEKCKGHKICPTFVNIYELSKSENLIKKTEIIRNAVQALFHFKNNLIADSPFIYLAKLCQNYEYNSSQENKGIFDFTSMFAKGGNFDPSKLQELSKVLENKRVDLERASKVFNDKALKIREKITNKKKHRKNDALQITAGFIDFCLKSITEGKVQLDGLDLNRIELFIKTLDHFFKTIELSTMKIQANDWYDLAILIYVQPGDVFWTKENRWLRLIEDAGCSKYLFRENEINVA